MDPSILMSILSSMGGGGGGGGGGGTLPNALPSLLQGLFGHSGSPYKNAGNVFKDYLGKSTGAYDKYQGMLDEQKDPSAFINKLMGGYQESPWARNLQKTSTSNALNAASASGLSGSTPLMNQIAQNSSAIASGDQNQWLQHVLGINSENLGGQQHISDALSKLFNNAGEYLGGTAYGEENGKNSDRSDLWSGISKLFGG